MYRYHRKNNEVYQISKSNKIIVYDKQPALSKYTCPFETILYEYISANPVGLCQMGNILSGIYFAVDANIKNTQGNRVIRTYYVNDLGTNFICYLSARYAGKGVLDAYPYTINTEIQKRINMNGLNEQDILYREEVLNLIIQQLRQWGIIFDKFEYESQVDECFIDKVNTYTDKDNLLKEKTTNLTLTRSDGSKLYSYKDICNNFSRLDRYDKVILAYGFDHKLYAESMHKIMNSVKFQIMISSKVVLNKQKLSKRKALDYSIDIYDKNAWILVAIDKYPQEIDLNDIDINVYKSKINFFKKILNCTSEIKIQHNEKILLDLIINWNHLKVKQILTLVSCLKLDCQLLIQYNTFLRSILSCFLFQF